MRYVRMPLIVMCLGLAILSQVFAEDFRPKGGFVPDEQTAIRIAVAVWEPIFGKDQIAREKPYRAVLANGVWTVTGSLPNNVPGGVAIVEISQADARIIRVSHGK